RPPAAGSTAMAPGGTRRLRPAGMATLLAARRVERLPRRRTAGGGVPRGGGAAPLPPLVRRRRAGRAHRGARRPPAAWTVPRPPVDRPAAGAGREGRRPPGHVDPADLRRPGRHDAGGALRALS